MKPNKNEKNEWTSEELLILKTLTTPAKIQDFLDSLEYSADPVYRSPRSVIRDKKAHCFDGALFAAACLARLGFEPIITDMLADNDDDHILALFKIDNCWGAIAKSNFAGLRYREPVFKSLRELIMSYFELYYNTKYQKTLRGYTLPLNLNQFNSLLWRFSDDNLDVIADKLDSIKKYDLFTPTQISNFILVDERTYKSGIAGANLDGIYQPD